MAAKRPTSTPATVTPTEAGPSDGAAVIADPALAAPDSSPAATTEVISEPETPVVENTVVEHPVVEQPVGEQPVVASTPAQQVVYVEAPKPFVKKSNRGFGVLIALVSAVIFAALSVVAQIILELIHGGQPVDFSFLSTTGFYAPTIMFAVGFILLVLVVNRAGWAAHVIGSIFVGLVVFFGGTGLLLLFNIGQIPSNRVGETFTAVLYSAELIIAALLAREVSLWMGFAIAARGRRVKARNVEARVLYDQEIAAKRAEYEQANAAAGMPVAAPADAPVAEAPAAEVPVAEVPVTEPAVDAKAP